MPVRIALAALLVLLARGPAFAQIVEFEARYWITDLHSGSVKTKDNEITGNDVDFHDDLGLKANGSPEGRLSVFTGPNSQIRLTYNHLTFSGDKVLTRTVTFQNQTFATADRVITDLDIHYGRLGWIWQPLNIPGLLKFGGMFEVKGFVADASLRTRGNTPEIKESGTFPLVVPTLGLALDLTPPPLPMLHIFGEVSGLPAGSLGHIVDAEVGLRYIPIRFFTVSAGYRIFDIGIGRNDDVAQLTLRGPFVGMSFRF